MSRADGNRLLRQLYARLGGIEAARPKVRVRRLPTDPPAERTWIWRGVRRPYDRPLLRTPRAR
jgi:hypothetical protein